MSPPRGSSVINYSCESISKSGSFSALRRAIAGSDGNTPVILDQSVPTTLGGYFLRGAQTVLQHNSCAFQHTERAKKLAKNFRETRARARVHTERNYPRELKCGAAKVCYCETGKSDVVDTLGKKYRRNEGYLFGMGTSIYLCRCKTFFADEKICIL